MSKADLNAKVPPSIDWYNTGIPTSSEISETSGDELIDGQSELGARQSSRIPKTTYQYPTTDLGPGPEGNMFGASVHANAQATIDEAQTIATTPILVRPVLEAIEAVEGFGSPEAFEAYGGSKGPGLLIQKDFQKNK